MKAVNTHEQVTLVDIPAIGIHRDGGTCVKKTSDGRFAVVASRPRKDGSLRLIKTFSDSLQARRYNFAIHGHRLGE